MRNISLTIIGYDFYQCKKIADPLAIFHEALRVPGSISKMRLILLYMQFYLWKVSKTHAHIQTILYAFMLQFVQAKRKSQPKKIKFTPCTASRMLTHTLYLNLHFLYSSRLPSLCNWRFVIYTSLQGTSNICPRLYSS